MQILETKIKRRCRSVGALFRNGELRKSLESRTKDNATYNIADYRDMYIFMNMFMYMYMYMFMYIFMNISEADIYMFMYIFIQDRLFSFRNLSGAGYLLPFHHRET